MEPARKLNQPHSWKRPAYGEDHNYASDFTTSAHSAKNPTISSVLVTFIATLYNRRPSS